MELKDKICHLCSSIFNVKFTFCFLWLTSLNLPDQVKKERRKVTAKPTNDLAESMRETGLIYWETGGLDRLMAVAGELDCLDDGGADCGPAHQITSLLSSFHSGNEEITQYVSTWWRFKERKYCSQKMTSLGRKKAASVWAQRTRHRDQNWAQPQTRETGLFSTVRFDPKRGT